MDTAKYNDKQSLQLINYFKKIFASNIITYFNQFDSKVQILLEHFH